MDHSQMSRKARRFMNAKARNARVVCLKPPKKGPRGSCDFPGCENEWMFVWHLRTGKGSQVTKRRCQACYEKEETS